MSAGLETRPSLPTGPLTFVFTDIEGSTRTLQRIGEDRFHDLMDVHDRLLRGSFESTGGTVVRTAGDSFFVVYVSAASAIAGVAQVQRVVARYEWPPDAQVRVRIGLHAGEGRLGGDDYVGLDVHRAARISAVGSGGQTVMSAATAALLERAVDQGVTMVDLGPHFLKDLASPEHLLQVNVTGLPTEFPPISSLDRPVRRLPSPVSSFVGRSSEVAMGSDLVLAHRLVTLTGPGGTGKTRLALRIADTVVDDFNQGAVFVPLVRVQDEELIPAALIDAMGMQQPSDGVDPKMHLLAYVAEKQLLLLLDNYEHLLGGARLVSEILEASPATHVLATSRAPLRLAGEIDMPVEPLPVPAAELDETGDPMQFASVELFVARAKAVDAGFDLTQENQRAVTELVRKLDGLPLAIELAAARAKMMTPDAILARLGDRLLSGGRDAPVRQRTLHDTIQWSYDLLDAAGADLFEKLAAFTGGAALDQIERLDSAQDPFVVWDGLATLVDHSLLLRTDVRGEPRFRMLETIRVFATDRLVQRPDFGDLRAEHTGVYLDLAESAAPHLTGPRRAEWLDRLALEQGNLDAAVEWAVEEGNTDVALRLVAAMWRFWQMRGHLDAAVEIIGAALALPGGSDETRAAAYEAAGGIHYWRGDDVMYDYYRTALEYSRKSGEEQTIASALYNLGYVAVIFESEQAGLSHLAEAEGIYRRLGDNAGLGRVAFQSANIAQLTEDYEEAAAHAERALEYLNRTRDSFDWGWAEFVLSENLVHLGRIEKAESHARSALGVFVEAGDVSAIVLFLGSFAMAALSQGDELRAMRMVGATRRLREETGTGLVEADPTRPEVFTTESIGSMSPQLQKAFAEGYEMNLEEVIDYAMTEH